MRHPTPTLHRGYILLLSLVFLGILFTIATAYLNFVTSSARSTRYNVENVQALSLAEAGIDAAISQLNLSANYTGEADTPLGAGTYTVVVSNVNTNTKQITATGFVPDAENSRATKTVTVLANINTTVVSFRYGAQVGAGGLIMSNNARIEGNLYTDGPISGSGVITGDAVAAGSTTTISGITVQGTARAHSLSNCTVGGDAYYQTISNCSVAGTQHPGSTDSTSEAMPISDTQINAWEAIAAAGTVINGNYTLNGSQTFGPAEIQGDLVVNGTLLLSGIVWVRGNITFGNNAKLTVSPITGNGGAILIADAPGSEATKGIVTLANNMDASGNGTAGSYPMIISTRTGSTAITLSNNVDSIILYASRGTITVANNAGANQITAYGLSLSNNAVITYMSGLQNQAFSSGPGGSWAVVPRTYSISD
ncbi:MAG: hypothetical protein WC798_01610 [Candidatus Paceibacterota bacterium]|jgi:Tfp pilus assembly protein PilX